MNRARLILAILLAIGLLAAPLTAESQQIPRVGYLSIYAPSDPRGERWINAFQMGLRERGYIEGQNVTTIYRYADGDLARLQQLATELVGIPADIILVTGDTSLRAATHATKSIPIVVSVIGDLLGPGYVQSLARPGGNVTGLTVLAPELSAKRMELLKECLPNLAKVGILWNPRNTVDELGVRAAESAARTLGIVTLSLEVQDRDRFDVAFRLARSQRVGALLVVSDALIGTNRQRILDFTTKYGVPSSFEDSQVVHEGGLMSYGPDLSDMHRRAAVFVDKIL